MRNFYRITVAVLLVFLLLVGGTVAFISSDRFHGYLSDKISASTHRKVAFGNDIKIDWGWPVTHITLNQISLANFEQGTRQEMLKIEKGEMSINLWSSLTGNLNFPEIILDKPDLVIEKDKDGNGNWDFSEEPGAATAAENLQPDERGDFPIIGRLVIKGGKVAYIDPQKDIDVLLDVDTVTGAADKKEELHFKGKGTYQKKDFSVDLVGGNIFQLKEKDDPYPVNLNFQVGATKANLTGTMTDPIQFKGMDTVLTLSGRDAAELFDVVGMALPPTPPYSVKGKLKYVKDIWRFNDFAGRMGSSDLRGSVSWDTTRERPLLSGEFRSKKLNFADLGGFVGAGPGASAKTKTDPYVIPDTPLDISRLKAMDAKVVFIGEKLISNDLPLDDFEMRVDLDNSILKLEPVRFGTAKGDIAAYMTVNARKEPVKIAGDFRFRKLDLKQIFSGLSKTLGVRNYAEGYLGGTAKLKGTGKSLRQMLATSNGDIGLGMEGGQLNKLVIELLGLDVAQGLGLFLKGDEPVRVRCMIGDFNVANGMMQVRHFVLDTSDSNIVGTGTINLKNEAMDLTLYTRPKDSSLITLNTPIHVRGTLKDPNIDLSKGRLAAKGAVAVALGALFPPAAIVAFVEPAFGKDSQCAALVREMARETGKQGKASLIPKNKPGRTK